MAVRFNTIGNSKWITGIAALVILIIGTVAYSNTGAAPFVFDDTVRIVYNKNIRTLLPAIAMSQSNRPIVNYTFALNYAIHGLDVWGYHAFNLAIHLFAAGILFGIVRRTMLLTNGIFSQCSAYLALVIAIIWVVHPLQTQAVTYINQRYESLMGLFYLLTHYCFIRSINSKHSSIWQIVSVLFCALGMGSKEAMASAPLIVLWYDRAFIDSNWHRLWSQRKFYYCGMATTWFVLFWAMVHYTDEYTSGGMVVVADLTPWTYLLSQSEVLLHYVRLAFWPQGQCFFDKWPIAQTIWEVFPEALCIMTLLLATIWAIFRSPKISFLGGWFFLILAPTSSFIPIRDLMFEHRMYLPLVSLVVAFVLASFLLVGRIARIFENNPDDNLRSLQSNVSYHAVLACIVIAALTMTTYARNSIYRSEITLWEDTTKKASRFSDVWLNLGISLVNAGRSDEALPHLLKAVELAPTDPLANSSLGGLLVGLGKYELAKEHLSLAIQENPKNELALRNMANLLLDTGKINEAIIYGKRALKLVPDDIELKMTLCAAFIMNQDFSQAIMQCEDVLVTQPSYTKAHLNLVSVYSQLGDHKKSVEHGMKAVDSEPKKSYDAGDARSAFGQHRSN